ncbi:hypothetical protein HII36_35555 [Nonomuraea sp. NN258]|uniref:competence protein CoiA family protein n=1 Tax=Nonomuraea antri TaxID=2730852 RepID=UPI0015693701|nr:competence protein CoiA family protein [Nonomuraea antri]NRQ37114.1 hypothetical protein [Nonomuraea antri]
MTDKRKVQTAVLGAPDSHEPIVMPFERADAILLRSRYSTRRFFCGEWLGGCGRELYTRIGSTRVPHFAHHPEGSDEPVTCRRSSNDEASADHLYIRRALVEWLRSHGHQVKTVALEGTVPRQGGTCTGMTIETTADLLFAVALRDDLRRDPQRYWPKRDTELRRRRKRVEWLFGPHVTLARQMIKRTGHAFTVTCRNEGLHRSVQIGLKEGGKIPLWVDLADCKIDEKGHLWTPRLAEMRHREASQSPSTNVKSPSPVTQEQHRAEMQPTGFPLSTNLLTVLPRTSDGQTIEAEISCPVATLPAEIVQVRLPRAASSLSIGHPYRIVGPALCVADSQPDERNLTWTIHAQDLSPLFHDEPEVKVVEKQVPQDSLWNKSIALLAELKQAQLSSDDAISARLRAELEELIPQLTRRQQIQARKQMGNGQKTRGPRAAPKPTKKPQRTSGSQARPAKKANVVDVHENQASILAEMIKRANSQGKRREAMELYEALRRFLNSLPAGERRDQFDQLARYRRQPAGEARGRRQ